MTPIVLMLLLVALLMLVNLGAHVRLRRAFGAQMASEEVRTDLIEIRSLSRSLQRDALNLIEDNDPAELAVLHGKVRSRSAEMQAWLDRLGRAPAFARAADRTPYFATQSIVLDRLTLTALLATRGERARALATFRQEVRPHEREASRIADAMIVSQNRDVETLQRRTAMADRQEVVLVTLAGVVLFTVAAVATVLIVRRSVLAPLLDIGRAMTLVAAGDTQDETPHVGRADEIGDMARAIEVFRASVRDREALREREVERQAREAEQTLERERARHRDEEAVATRTAAITRSAQALESQLGEVLRSMRASSAQLATTSRDLAQHSSAAGTGLGDVAGAVARALDGATDIATATARFTDAIDAASERTRRSAELGAGAAAQSLVVAAKMARVQDATINIGTVVSLIAGIAKQTSLLALNASIEAARAGDAGRGFAVVAGEVKQLAGQTAKSTDNIACQIAEMQLAARDAGGSLDQIRAMIGDIAHETQALADGIGEQAVSARVINRNLSGAAADLNLIEDRVNDVAGVASGVDALARHVNGDAGLLEHSAAMIDRALSTFFAELTKVRAAAEAGRGIAS